eukprot:10542681-Alexandrium_andersonii.AAC.1
MSAGACCCRVFSPLAACRGVMSTAGRPSSSSLAGALSPGPSLRRLEGRSPAGKQLDKAQATAPSAACCSAGPPLH